VKEERRVWQIELYSKEGNKTYDSQVIKVCTHSKKQCWLYVPLIGCVENDSVPLWSLPSNTKPQSNPVTKTLGLKGSSWRAPALQVQSPEFKPQSPERERERERERETNIR
jgi:hypothetical protein